MSRHLLVMAPALAALALAAGCASTRRATHNPPSNASNPASPQLAAPAPQATLNAPPISGGDANEVENLPGLGEENPVVQVSDPLEPVNRGFFYFNDKLYFWLLKPVAQGYRYVAPLGLRQSVGRFFSNVATPVRAGNCLLQAEFTGAGTEMARFAINTTVGLLGFTDPAHVLWHLDRQDRDFGQTLGRYGVGPWIYIDWPVIGPLSARDTVGYVGDTALDPFTYLVPQWGYNIGIKACDTVNTTSMRIGDYENLKHGSIDPYVALRDVYYQYRQHLVNPAEGKDVRPPVPTVSD